MVPNTGWKVDSSYSVVLVVVVVVVDDCPHPESLRFSECLRRLGEEHIVTLLRTGFSTVVWETIGTSKGAYLWWLHLWNAKMTLSFILICATVNRKFAQVARHFKCWLSWSVNVSSTHNLRTSDVRETCFTLALHHTWSFFNKGCWFILRYFTHCFSFACFASRSAEGLCFIFLHHGHFCWGLPLGLHPWHEIPQGLQTSAIIYFMRVCYISFGCFPSPYPSSSLTVTETRIRWVKRWWISGELGSCWWLVGYHQAPVITILWEQDGTRSCHQNGIGCQYRNVSGSILWFRLLASLLLLTPDFYIGKSDKKARIDHRAGDGWDLCWNLGHNLGWDAFLRWIPLLFVGSSGPQCSFHPRLESYQWMLISQIFLEDLDIHMGIEANQAYECVGPLFSNITRSYH